MPMETAGIKLILSFSQFETETQLHLLLPCKDLNEVQRHTTSETPHSLSGLETLLLLFPGLMSSSVQVRPPEML